MFGFLFTLAAFLAVGFLAYAVFVRKTFNAFVGESLKIDFKEALSLAWSDLIELKAYVLVLIHKILP